MRKMTTLLAALALLALGTASGAAAQIQNQPQLSPRAAVEQQFGLTEVRVDYHRPSVKGRTLWGELVPYGEVWRAGANENTTLSVSTDVRFQGKDLAAGTYGFFVIPEETGAWTVALSSASASWGAYSYAEDEDVLRVTVQPVTGPATEQLVYRFENVQRDSVVLALYWGEIRLPIEITADTLAVTLDSMREELRGAAQFGWAGWSEAAAFCAGEEACISDPALRDEAIGWAERSVQLEARMSNLMTLATLLDAKGDSTAAGEARERGLRVGQPLEIHRYARQVLAQGKPEEALKIFQMNAERFPDAWIVELGLSRGYGAVGDQQKAIEHMRRAKEAAPEFQRDAIQGLIDRLEKGESIE